MPLWGITDTANNAPKYVAGSLSLGSGKTAEAANNTALYGNNTQNAFVPGMTVGVFAATPAKMANTTGEGKKVTTAGWQLRRAGQGPLVAATATGGSGFGNGDTILITGGSVNATMTLTTNVTGNLVSALVVPGSSGRFANTSQITSTAFQREKHLTAITVAGTPVGYANTDVIRASNGTVNATATISTNSTGGFVTGNVTITAIGTWANAKVANDVLFTVLSANGGASAGSGATFAATLAASTGGTVAVTVLGGRAGRVHYECLVQSGSIASNGSIANTVLPQ